VPTHVYGGRKLKLQQDSCISHRLDVILLFYYIVTGKVFLITGENYGGSSYEVKLEGVKE